MVCKSGGCHCGPHYLPDSVRRFFSGWFNKECKKHDLNYEIRKGKLTSDLIFYKDMIATSGINPIKQIVALLYFIVVLCLGWISYYFRN